MEQFGSLAAVQATFAQYNCKGNENSYVFAQDDIMTRKVSDGGYYGGGLIGGMVASAVTQAVRDKKQEQEMIPGQMNLVLDVTETGIGALAVKKAGIFKKWNTASVVENTQLFYILYSDMEFVELKKSLGAYALTFRTKTGVTFRARIFSKLKEIEYQDAGLQAIIARFGLN